MGLLVVRNDITKIEADAIVNSANPKPRYLNGVDRAIFEAAGEDLLKERIAKGCMDEGEVLITEPYNLCNHDKPKIIIHVVVPKWNYDDTLMHKKLKNCYSNVLDAAIECTRSIESVAFPLLGTGVNGYPIIDAYKVAEDVCREYILSGRIKDIIICVFDSISYKAIEEIHGSIAHFIEDAQVKVIAQQEYKQKDENGIILRLPNVYEELGIIEKDYEKNIKDSSKLKYDYFKDTDLDFFELLFHYYDRYKSDTHKIDELIAADCGMSKPTLLGYRDKKRHTVDRDSALKFCIGLNLNYEEAELLLRSANYVLNESNKRDSIILKHLKTTSCNNRLQDLNIELKANNLSELDLAEKHNPNKNKEK